jgi:hypothetical protein
VFVIGREAIIANNRFERCFGGYYAGAIFISGGNMNQQWHCANDSVDTALPCADTFAEIRGNVFDTNFAEFGGHIQVSNGGGAGARAHDVGVRIEENLFVNGQYWNPGPDRPWDHMAGSAINCKAKDFRIRRNTFLDANWTHPDSLIRNTGAVTFNLEDDIDFQTRLSSRTISSRGMSVVA